MEMPLKLSKSSKRIRILMKILYSGKTCSGFCLIMGRKGEITNAEEAITDYHSLLPFLIARIMAACSPT